MIAFTALVPHNVVRDLGLTLVHFLWQGAAILLVFVALSSACRRAGVRYALALTALAAMLAAPIATFVALHSSAGHAWPAVAWADEIAEIGTGVAASAVVWTNWIVAGWIAGVATLAIRTAGGWYLVQSLRHRRTEALPSALLQRCRTLAQVCGVKRPVQFLLSAAATVPMVIGLFRPVVLLPVAVVTGLPLQQLEALILHELAHIRRWDAAANLFQIVVETLLFYHPAVWWLSRRARIERENCCDDVAVALSQDAIGYARALTVLETLRPASGYAIAATGSPLKQRVLRLIDGGARANNASAALATLALLMLVSGFAAGGIAARADATPTRADRGFVEPYVRPVSALEVATAAQALPARSLPEYVRILRDGGIDVAALSADDLIVFKAAGVTPTLIRGLQSLGFAELTPDDYVTAQAQGLTPEFLEAVRKHKFHHLTIQTLVALKQIGAFG